MILFLSTTHKPATDLGFLLHKNPARVHEADLSFGKCRVIYPEANDERCTVALTLDVDPVRLVRGNQGPTGEGGLFDQYVNDRPYVASSFLSSGILEMFSTAMNGRSKERQELADAGLPLEVRLPVVSARGGEPFLRRMFEPLGYEVDAKRLPLDPAFPEWGESAYFDLTLRRTGRLMELLNHLYVLIPVLDDEKHYWVDRDEIEKLLNRGKTWLSAHPDREEITKRYLRRRPHLTREALARLAEDDVDPDRDEQNAAEEEEAVEKRISLHEIRLNTVAAALKESHARRVLDLGCGEGRLIKILLGDKQFDEVVGMDVSLSVLDRAETRLKLDRKPSAQAKRVKLIQGSLVYRDRRLDGYDAAAAVEVIEHLDPDRLTSFERNLFEFARPRTVILTTPNREYNVLFETLSAGSFRHRDHRFEWTRSEFAEWGNMVADRHGYRVRYVDVGPIHEEHGAPSQMAVFERG